VPVVLAALAALAPAVGAEPANPLPPETFASTVTLDVLPVGVPMDRLDAPGRAVVATVFADTIFAHRVEGIRYPSRAPIFRYLLDHPDFAAGVARALGVGEYWVAPLGDGYWGDDNRGVTGTIQLLYADEGRRLYHAAGSYEHRRLPTMRGQLLILLEFRHRDEGEGRSVAETSLTGHLRLDSPIVGALARVIAALTRPLVERAVERKVERFFATVAQLSGLAHDQPEMLATLLQDHPEVPAGPRLDGFLRVLRADQPPAWARVPFTLAPVDSAAP
jgi:hypothetical protein